MLNFFKFLARIFSRQTITPARITVVLQSGYDADKPIQRDKDIQLSEHFSLFELTTTSNLAFQQQNRLLSDNQVQKLKKLARHAEAIRSICSGAVHIHSGYRSAALNGSTTGASSTSQHPRCEAIDFDIAGCDLEETFTKLRGAAAGGTFVFGQLIHETANRGYTVTEWIHSSVPGTLDRAKMGQVLVMKDGAYVLIDRVKFEEPNKIG